MRRFTTRWLPFLVIPLIALSFAPTVRADPIPYSSWGDVGGGGAAPIGNFIINSTNGTLLGPGSMALASFQAPTVPSGATLTFTNMPFFISVEFQPNGQNGPTPELTIQGGLNGTLTGTTSSDVVATVTSVQATGPYPLPFSLNSFNVLAPQTLAPSGINGGTTVLIGQVTALSTPEPTPLAMLGLLAGWVAYRVVGRRGRRTMPTG